MSAMDRNPIHKPQRRAQVTPGNVSLRRAVAVLATLGCMFSTGVGLGLAASDQPVHVVGEKKSTISTRSAAELSQNATTGCSPEALLRRETEARTPRAADLLNPASPLWAGANALSLRHTRPEILLAEGIIAYSGDGHAAAAAKADGTILLFSGLCGPVPRMLSMPGGHPAFALAISADGASLVAWSQGTGEFVFFDVAGRGAEAVGKTLPMSAPLAGSAMLALSGDGRTLAAVDGSGALWAGSLGGEMRPLGRLADRPVLLSFSPGGGVLAAANAAGSGNIWNPRTGKVLRAFTIPGGPFTRGETVKMPGTSGNEGGMLRLWSTDNTPVLWDIVLGDVAGESSEPGRMAVPTGGSFHLRGQGLFYVGAGHVWNASPDYEPLSLGLSWSEQERCLRLQDLDGAVRYYSAESGAPKTQCFAVDWSPVEIRADGTAAVPGLGLRVFDPIGASASGRQVNARAISRRSILLWASRSGGVQPEHQTQISETIAVLQSVVDENGLAIPLRGALADLPATRFLHPER